MCTSQRSVRSGGWVTPPNHGSPIFPLTLCGAAHELQVSGHDHGYKYPQLQERAAAFPALARQASRDRAVSPSIWLYQSYNELHYKHQQLRGVSCNSSDADDVSSRPPPLSANGSPKSLLSCLKQEIKRPGGPDTERNVRIWWITLYSLEVQPSFQKNFWTIKASISPWHQAWLCNSYFHISLVLSWSLGFPDRSELSSLHLPLK